MQVTVIQPASAAPSLLAAMPGVIENVGRRSFASDLFATARHVTRTENLTAFVAAPDGSVHTLIAEDTGPSEKALQVAERYVARHWRVDPANAVMLDGADERGCWGVRMHARDIGSASFRSECYTSVGLAERFSLFQKRPAGTLRVSFYRGRGDSFPEETIERVVDCAPLLMATLWRHYETTHAGENRPGAATFRTRLETLTPALSGREREVCALVAAGVTSEGIALELGVGINTVLTYRKRAYARLGISSQNELMRLLM